MTDFAELQQLSIDWLEGRTDQSPWSFGPPDPETPEIRHHLVRISSVPGIVTTGSQPEYRGLIWKQRATISGLATDEGLDLLRGEAERHDLVLLARSTDMQATFDGCPVMTTRFGREYSTYRTEVVSDTAGLGVDTSGLIGFVLTTREWVGSSRLWAIFGGAT